MRYTRSAQLERRKPTRLPRLSLYVRIRNPVQSEIAEVYHVRIRLGLTSLAYALQSTRQGKVRTRRGHL
jgi:hypothetical protein